MEILSSSAQDTWMALLTLVNARTYWTQTNVAGSGGSELAHE